MMKYLTKVLIVLFTFAAFFCNAESEIGGDEKATSSNVLLIIVDQLTSGAMSCAGNKYVKTPSLDKLAFSGIRFENNYVTQPLCLPFRSILQTSRYSNEIGGVNNG